MYLIHERVAKPQRYRVEIGELPIKSADPSQIYCLSMQANAASQDQIGVTSENNGLLKRVYTRAKDRSVDIVTAVAQVGAGGAVANATGGTFRIQGAQATDTTQTETRFGPYEIDPFDVQHMQLLNGALGERGLCVTLGGRGDPFVPYSNLCASAAAAGGGFISSAKGYSGVGRETQPATPLPPEPWGVLYRPLIKHTLKVYRKGSGGTWSLVQNRAIEMPNAAPALAVSVKRAAFTERETDLKFDGGVLYSVDMEKGSEVAGFVLLPIKVAQVIVGIPAEIIRVRIQSASQNTDLIRANNELIAALAALKEAEANLAATQGEVANRDAAAGTADFNLRSPEDVVALQTYCLSSTINAAARLYCMEGGTRCVQGGNSVEQCIGQ